MGDAHRLLRDMDVKYFRRERMTDKSARSAFDGHDDTIQTASPGREIECGASVFSNHFDNHL